MEMSFVDCFWIRWILCAVDIIGIVLWSHLKNWTTWIAIDCRIVNGVHCVHLQTKPIRSVLKQYFTEMDVIFVISFKHDECLHRRHRCRILAQCSLRLTKFSSKFRDNCELYHLCFMCIVNFELSFIVYLTTTWETSMDMMDIHVPIPNSIVWCFSPQFPIASSNANERKSQNSIDNWNAFFAHHWMINLRIHFPFLNCHRINIIQFEHFLLLSFN